MKLFKRLWWIPLAVTLFGGSIYVLTGFDLFYSADDSRWISLMVATFLLSAIRAIIAGIESRSI